MRVALCISGELRHGFASFPYIYNSFLNRRDDVDVFIHSWESNNDVFELYSAKHTILDDCEPTREYLINTLKLNSDVTIDGTSNISNNLLMYFGINKVISLVDYNYDTYDILIRIRPDMYLNNKLNLDKIISDIRSDKYDIQIPNSKYNFGGYNDQIAIGNRQSMKVYGNFINQIEAISNKYKIWHSETLLKYYLDEFNIRVNQLNYDYRLLRDVTLRLSSTIFEDKSKETKIIY